MDMIQIIRRLLLYVGIILLILTVLVFIGFSHFKQQFSSNIDYIPRSVTSLPNGIHCVYHDCNVLEQIFINLFHIGEEIRFDHIDIQKSSQQSSTNMRPSTHYYKVHGRNNLASVIMVGSGKVHIARPSTFQCYCSSSEKWNGRNLAHNEVFSIVMDEIYSCSSAMDISFIRLEHINLRNDAENYERVLSDAALISDVWSILLAAKYDCGNEDCSDARIARKNGKASERALFDPWYTVSLVFQDGSEFCFSLYDAESRALMFALSDTKETLYLTSDQNEQLMSLFQISGETKEIRAYS